MNIDTSIRGEARDQHRRKTLERARAALGTKTVTDTVNTALRQAIVDREQQLAAALDVFARAKFADRSDAWR